MLAGTGWFDGFQCRGAFIIFIVVPINIQAVTSASLSFRNVSRGNYGSLQEIINSNASLSLNEAARIGSSADGDVVRLIAVLTACVTHATVKRVTSTIPIADCTPRYDFFFSKSVRLSDRSSFPLSNRAVVIHIAIAKISDKIYCSKHPRDDVSFCSCGS